MCGVNMVVCAAPLTADFISPTDQKLDGLFSIYAANKDGGVEIKELEQSYEAFQRKQFDDCLAQLMLAREKHSNLPPARIMLSIFFLQTQQPVQARSLLESVAVEHARYPPLYEAFGRLALIEGRTTDALVQIERAKSLVAESDWDQTQRDHFIRQCDFGLAAVAEGRRDWQTAERYLAIMLDHDPEDSVARRRLAQVFFHQEKTELAYREFRRATSENDALEPAEITMARLYSQEGKHDRAEGWLRKARALHPDAVIVLVTYGSWLLDRGSIDEAAVQAEQAENIAPDNPQVKVLLGMLSRCGQEHEEAERYFQELLTDHPGNFDYSNQLALSLIEQQVAAKRQKALELAEVNARQFPRSEPALATLGWVYYRLGRLADAQRALQAAIAGGRATSDTACYLAHVMSDSGKPDEARILLERALTSTGRFIHRDEAQAWLDRLSTKPDEGQQKSQQIPD